MPTVPPHLASGIGIGCAGPVDPLTGLINNPYTLPTWDNCNIVSTLRDKFEVPVFLENDADAALLGEVFSGAGKGCDPAVMLTFGTGVGGSAISGGRIYRGVAGGHPEIGHIPVSTGGPKCYCGIEGCLESIASGTAIAQAGHELGLADSREVFAAAHSGAKAIIERAVHATASAAWALLHTFMPQRIILGGGLMDEHYALFATAIQQKIARATMLLPGHCDVAKAVLGNDAGLVGAASLALNAPLARPKRQVYQETKERIRALVHGEQDEIAIMATVAAELHASFPDFNWVGFYRVISPGLLKIGPYQGGHGCLTISFERGVCGKCAREKATQLVPDVTKLPYHIACSSTTRSEIVVPIVDAHGELRAVLDIDSDRLAAFDAVDQAQLEELVRELSPILYRTALTL